MSRLTKGYMVQHCFAAHILNAVYVIDREPNSKQILSFL